MNSDINDATWIQTIINDWQLSINAETRRRLVVNKHPTGYNWISPISGHNYAYSSLVNKADVNHNNTANLETTWWQSDMLASSIIATAWLPQKAPIRTILALLLPPVIITEAYAFFERSKWSGYLKMTREEQQEKFGTDSYVIAQYNGEVPAFMEAQSYKLNTTSLSQGMSIVTSAGGGFVMTELFYKNKYKKMSWFWLLTIGLFGSYAVIDNLVSLYRNGFRRGMGGNRVGHEFHAIGVITGALSSAFLC